MGVFSTLNRAPFKDLELAYRGHVIKTLQNLRLPPFSPKISQVGAGEKGQALSGCRAGFVLIFLVRRV